VSAQRFAGSQLIADRDGWLRIHAGPLRYVKGGYMH
jgi:hypothetical protein